jgi:hypothetical protein
MQKSKCKSWEVRKLVERSLRVVYPFGSLAGVNDMTPESVEEYIWGGEAPKTGSRRF